MDEDYEREFKAHQNRKEEGGDSTWVLNMVFVKGAVEQDSETEIAFETEAVVETDVAETDDVEQDVAEHDPAMTKTVDTMAVDQEDVSGVNINSRSHTKSSDSETTTTDEGGVDINTRYRTDSIDSETATTDNQSDGGVALYNQALEPADEDTSKLSTAETLEATPLPNVGPNYESDDAESDPRAYDVALRGVTLNLPLVGGRVKKPSTEQEGLAPADQE